jgi:hypothetical protein
VIELTDAGRSKSIESKHKKSMPGNRNFSAWDEKEETSREIDGTTLCSISKNR